MNTLPTTVVETAIDSLSNSASVKMKPIYQAILNQVENKSNDNIYDCIWVAAANNHNANVRDKARCDQTGAQFTPDIWNITFYGICQKIMDRVAWSARALTVSRGKQDEIDMSIAGSTGLDYTQDQADIDYGTHAIDTTTLQNIREEVLEIYRSMSIVSAHISSQLKLPRAEPLYLFAPSTVDQQGNWSVPVKCDDWDHALAVMQDTADDLAAASKVEAVNSSAKPTYGTAQRYTITRNADTTSGPATTAQLNKLVASTNASIDAKKAAYAQANRESHNGSAPF